MAGSNRTKQVLVFQNGNFDLKFEERSRVVLLEFYEGKEASSARSKIHLRAGSELEHYFLCKADVDSRTDVVLENDCAFHSFVFESGAKNFSRNLSIELEGPSSTCTIDGLFLGQNRDHIAHETQVHHRSPSSTSVQNLRSVMDDRAAGSFLGRILIDQEAADTKADQHTNNLLLSKHASVLTKPELEIYAQDVSCTHGATVGRLDADEIFYLRTRGYGLEEARALLIYAFSRQAMKAVMDEDVRRWISAELGRTFGVLDSGGNDA